MIYITTFAFSCVLLKQFSKYRVVLKARDRYRIYLSLAVLAVLPPCILAGLRSPDIGADVRTYVIYGFDRAMDYTSLWELFNNHRLELFYEGLMYIVSRFTDDIHWLHFVSSLIIVYGVYSFIKTFGNKISISLALYTFYALYFNQSLNTIRQWIATGIFLFSIKYMKERRLVPYILCSICALLFHNSAIILFLIYPMYQLTREHDISDPKVRKKERRRGILLVICTILISIFFEPLGRLGISVGILPVKFLHYFTDTDGAARLFMIVLSQIPVLLAILFWGKKLIKYDHNNQPMIIFLIIGFILQLLSPRFGYASRIATYFSVWQIVFYSEVYSYLKTRIRPIGGSDKPLQYSFILV